MRFLALQAALVFAFLAAVDARPACACSTKIKAYITAMRSDLRNLVVAQEAFRDTSRRYAAGLAELGAEFRSSTNVTVTIDRADEKGWSGHATHPGTTAACRAGVGAYAIAGPGAEEVACDPDPGDAEKRVLQYEAYALFLLVSAAAGAVAWRRRRRGVLFALVALAVVNPFWLEPKGTDCGEMVMQLGWAWVVVALLIGVYTWRRPPRLAA